MPLNRYNEFPSGVPVELVGIEDATVTTGSESYTGTTRMQNDYIIVDGADDITFSVYPRLATDTAVTFTMKQGEIMTVPFHFLKLAWAAASSTSAFRCVAHKI